MKNLIKNGTDLLFRRQTGILSAAFVIAGAVLLSRVLGLLKFRLLNDSFTVAQTGLFWAAFRLPNTIFDLIVMGALTTAFIPIFTSLLSSGREKQANRVASTILNLCTLVFAAISVLFLIFASPIMHLVAPGLNPGELAQVTSFTRIMLIGQTLPLILGNFLTGILQSHKRFLLPALAPVAYNLGIILGIIFLSPSMGLYGAVWGVVIGAVLFFVIQIPVFSHTSFSYTPVLDLKDEGVRAIGKLVLPRAFGLAISQLNYTVNLAVCSLLSTRAIAIFNYAQQLEQLPVSIFATTIAQAALPTLSEEKDQPDQLMAFKKTFSSSFLQVMFLVLPAAAILIILRIPIVRLVYGASKFDWLATVDTGRTLAFLAAGLIAESAISLLVRAFFALHDSKTPVLIGAFTVIINIALSVILIPMLHFPIWGLGLAVAVADTIQAIFLLIFLQKKVALSLSEIVIPMSKMGFAAIVTGFSLYVPMKLLDQLVFDTTRTVPLLMLTGTAGIIGLSVYLFLVWVFDVSALGAFLGVFGKIRSAFSKAEDTVSTVVAGTSTESLTN